MCWLELANLLGVAALFAIELCGEQHVVHPDDAVHRRADFVTDVAQERRLHVEASIASSRARR